VNGFTMTLDQYGYLNTKTFYKTDEGYKAALGEAHIIKDVSVLTGKFIENQIEFDKASGTDCGRPAVFLNHYFLYPQAKVDHRYLMLATTVDATRSIAVNPGQLKSIRNLHIKYQYNYGE
jgi:hypothetical protein